MVPPDFCVDYQCLNSVTKVDMFLLPRVNDCLDLLMGHSYFTLDLASRYWMAKESQEKTCIMVYMSLPCCHLVCVTLQKLMGRMLKGLVNDKYMFYLDNILVIGWSFAEIFEK